MIKYKLQCDVDHEFEGWFRDSADYDDQAQKSLVECPICGSASVRKAVMAPSIARRDSARSERLAEIRGEIANAAKRARDYVEKNFDYVGARFPEEARKIHYGETAERGIYGEASKDDVRELIDEGVKVAPVPGVANASDKAGELKAPLSPATKKLN